MKKILYISVLCIITLLGCEKEEIPYFTGGDSANFWIHSLNHSLFGASSSELPQDTIILDVSLSGKTATYDRIVKVVAQEDESGVAQANKLTTAKPEHYILLDGVIPANELTGTVKVVVKNPEILATQDDLKLRVKIVDSEHLTYGLKENNYVNIKWSRLVLQPSTFGAMRFFFCSTYSTRVYLLFMEVTGLKEFYYYQGLVSVDEANVMGINFAKRVRELSEEQGSPLLHDDGPSKGLPIVTVF